MINEQNVQSILDDYKNGRLHKEIMAKYQFLTVAQDYAITNCSKGLSLEQIVDRVGLIKDNMMSGQIMNIMQGNK